jgi:hypothetical protein
MIASQIAFHQVRPLSRLVLLNGAALGMQANTGLSLGALQRVSYAFFFQLPFRPERLLAAGNDRAIREAFTGRMAGRRDRITPEDVRVFQEAMARPGALTCGINYYRAQAHRKTSPLFAKRADKGRDVKSGAGERSPVAGKKTKMRRFACTRTSVY